MSTNPLRIAVIGCTLSTKRCLELIASLPDMRIVGIITQSDFEKKRWPPISMRLSL